MANLSSLERLTHLTIINYTTVPGKDPLWASSSSSSAMPAAAASSTATAGSHQAMHHQHDHAPPSSVPQLKSLSLINCFTGMAARRSTSLFTVRPEDVVGSWVAAVRRVGPALQQLRVVFEGADGRKDLSAWSDAKVRDALGCRFAGALVLGTHAN